jgi:hypothetical protein
MPSNRPDADPTPSRIPAVLREHADRCKRTGEFDIFDLTGNADLPGAACDLPPE